MRRPRGFAGCGRELLVSESGSSLVEFVLTLSLLFTLIFCFFELCLALYTYDVISESAREGTRYAMVRGASCRTSTGVSCQVSPDEVNSYVSGLGWPNVGGGTMNVNTTYPDGSEAIGSRVQVNVTYQFRITMPFVPSNAISLSSTSVMYIIQ